MSKKKDEKVVNFSDVYKGDMDSEGQIAELVNKTFVIRDVSFDEFNLGRVAIATIEIDGKTEKRHTFSSVLIKQLEEVKKYTDEGIGVRVTLKKRKNYYYFE